MKVEYRFPAALCATSSLSPPASRRRILRDGTLARPAAKAEPAGPPRSNVSTDYTGSMCERKMITVKGEGWLVGSMPC